MISFFADFIIFWQVLLQRKTIPQHDFLGKKIRLFNFLDTLSVVKTNLANLEKVNMVLGLQRYLFHTAYSISRLFYHDNSATSLMSMYFFIFKHILFMLKYNVCKCNINVHACNLIVYKLFNTNDILHIVKTTFVAIYKRMFFISVIR